MSFYEIEDADLIALRHIRLRLHNSMVPLSGDEKRDIAERMRLIIERIALSKFEEGELNTCTD